MHLLHGGTESMLLQAEKSTKYLQPEKDELMLTIKITVKHLSLVSVVQAFPLVYLTDQNKTGL